MEEGHNKKRNVRPVEKSNLPTVTLFILTGIVLALFYVGYEYLSDSTGDTKELTQSTPDENKEIVSLDVYSQPSEVEEVVEHKPKVEEKVVAAVKKEETKVAAPTAGEAYTHTVKSGETLFSVASRYNLKAESLKALNPNLDEAVKAGQKLKVRVQGIHTVGPGDILRVVAGKYGITVEQLMQANGKSKNFAERGEKLVIPFKSKQ